MKSYKIIPSLIFLLLALIASFFLGRCTDAPDNTTARIITKIDTVVLVKDYPPDTFIVSKPRLVFRTDTIIDSLFIAEIKDTAWTASDEIISSKSDTLRSEFLYPEMMFRHRFNYSKDSIKTITIFNEKIIEKPRPWWEIPASVLGGVAVGYLFGRIK